MCLATCGPCNIYIFCLRGNAHSNPLSVYLLDYYFFNGNSSAYSLDIRFLIHSGYKINGAGWLINTNLFFKVLHIGKFKNKTKHHVLCHTSNSLFVVLTWKRHRQSYGVSSLRVAAPLLRAEN